MLEPYAVDLPLVVDERGWLIATDKALAGMKVAYAYATSCAFDQRKGWHRHARHTDRIFCVSGWASVVAWRVEVALWDGLPNGQRDERRWLLDVGHPRLIVVPPGWWHGFQAMDGEPCVVVNCPDLPYDPEDQEDMEWLE